VPEHAALQLGRFALLRLHFVEALDMAGRGFVRCQMQRLALAAVGGELGDPLSGPGFQHLVQLLAAA
jgi:hypothetical protein